VDEFAVFVGKIAFLLVISLAEDPKGLLEMTQNLLLERPRTVPMEVGFPVEAGRYDVRASWRYFLV
jgi:hypothetical protein